MTIEKLYYFRDFYYKIVHIATTNSVLPHSLVPRSVMISRLSVATIISLFALAASKKKCTLENGLYFGSKSSLFKSLMTLGLECDSWETLNPGSSFMVESKTCKKGRYPKNENCEWFFDVNGCTPTLHCDMIDIKGRGKK